jgi:hypothetical protein
MSLTSQLTLNASTRAFLDRISPRLWSARGNSAAASVARARLGFNRLVTAKLFVPRPESMTPGEAVSVGMAFDYRTRMMLRPMDPRETLAARGIASINSAASGSREAHVLTEAFETALFLIRDGSADELDTVALILAWCESLYRSPDRALLGPFGDTVRRCRTGSELISRIPAHVLSDLRQLRVWAGAPQVEEWLDQVASGASMNLNPGFSGAHLVDGADGDWVIGDTLVDCKVTSHFTVTKLREYMVQLLGYVMLDQADEIRIRRIALWFPRQRALQVWSLNDLLGPDIGSRLVTLRSDFNRVVGHRDSAVAVSPPQDELRMTRILASNRHTPFDELTALGLHPHLGVRVNVARNLSTPIETLRRLAHDSRFEVRAKVAANPNTPADVLAALKTDRVHVVRMGAIRQSKALGASPQDGCDAEPLVPSPEPSRRVDGFAEYLTAEQWALFWLNNAHHGTWVEYAEVLQPVFGRAFTPLRDYDYEGYCSDDTYVTERQAGREEWQRLRDIFVSQEQRATLDEEEDSDDDVDAAEPESRVSPGALVVLALEPRLPTASALLRAELSRKDASEADRALALEQMSRSSDVSLRESAAWWADDPAMLRLMALDRRADVRAAVAGNGRTPSDVLALLGGEPTKQVRRIVAANPRTPPEVLSSLATVRDTRIRRHVATNSSAPAEVRMELALSGDNWIDSHLAVDPSTPVEVLLRLSIEGDLRVCLGTVVNRATPREILEDLADDSDPVVRTAAAVFLERRRILAEAADMPSHTASANLALRNR